MTRVHRPCGRPSRGTSGLMGRCLHRRRGVCPSCRAFTRALVLAIERPAEWTPGIMARLSREAGRPS